jgi:hypothetical protein
MNMFSSRVDPPPPPPPLPPLPHATRMSTYHAPAIVHERSARRIRRLEEELKQQVGVASVGSPFFFFFESLYLGTFHRMFFSPLLFFFYSLFFFFRKSVISSCYKCRILMMSRAQWFCRTVPRPGICSHPLEPTMPRTRFTKRFSRLERSAERKFTQETINTNFRDELDVAREVKKQVAGLEAAVQKYGYAQWFGF